MTKYVIHGGKPLFGEIDISGAKNAAVLAAQILAVSDDALAAKLDAAREKMAEQIAAKEAKKLTAADNDINELMVELIASHTLG